jgi:signal transduction histidine kinase
MSEPHGSPPAGEVISAPSRQEGGSQRGQRAQIEFLSRAGHELRSPLNAMLGFAQILELDRAEPLTSLQRERVGQIKTAGWRLLQLINDLLDLSRIEAGQLQVSMTALASNRIIDEALGLVATQAASRRVHLQREASPEATVWGNATRLRQVLLNLLSGAIERSPPGGRVELHVQAHEGQRLALSIRDTAVAPIQDTGIGLAMSRKLIELMGAELQVRSEAGCGSEFRIVLRLAQAP